MPQRKAAGLRCMQSSGVIRRAVRHSHGLFEQTSSLSLLHPSWKRRANEECVGRLACTWQVAWAGRDELRGWWSSGPASPWCSTAYAGWTGWWCRRVSAEALGGNWLQLLAASRWGGGLPPGSSALQDTESQREISVISGRDEFHAERTSGELRAFQSYTVCSFL